MSVRLLLIGPPGGGKGTQAQRLSKRYDVPHISTGDILRQAVRDGSDLGRQVAATIAGGALVSDALISELVRERLAQPDAAAGFLLDGYPRTAAQTRTLDTMLEGRSLIVALIAVPDDAIVRRLSSRRVCTSCRLTQSVSDADDPHAETCPYCGGRLARREDDEPETVRRRLAIYASLAEPVIAHYRPRSGFITIDGLQPPDVVTRALFTEIDRLIAR